MSTCRVYVWSRPTGYGRKELVSALYKGWLIGHVVMNSLYSNILKLTPTSMAASSQKVQEMLCRPGKLERDQFKYHPMRTLWFSTFRQQDLESVTKTGTRASSVSWLARVEVSWYEIYSKLCRISFNIFHCIHNFKVSNWVLIY